MLEQVYTKGASAALEHFGIKTALTDETKRKVMEAAAARRGMKYTGTGGDVTAEALHIARTGRTTAPVAAAVQKGRGMTGGGSMSVSPDEMAKLKFMNVSKGEGVGAGVKRFMSGQGAAASKLMTGLRNIGSERGRGMAWQGLKGVAPTIGLGLGAAGLYSMLGNDDRRQSIPQQMMNYGRY